MPALPTSYISAALKRLRSAVNICCGVVMLSLLGLLLVWALASFADLRYTVLEAHAAPAQIISAAEHEESAFDDMSSAQAQAPEPVAAIDLNRVLTKHDAVLARANSIARGAGVIAMVLLIPIMLAGMMLAAASATQGVERVVSAFLWTMAVAMLVLPVGELLGLPWREGGLTQYDYMTAEVDAVFAASTWGNVTFYARFLGLPLTCVVGLAVIMVRFSMGVEAGIIPKEDHKIDPTLEKEAGNIKTTSLHGGRAAGALRGIATSPQVASNGVTPAGSAAAAAAAAPAPAAAPTMPLSMATRDIPPRRLI